MQHSYSFFSNPAGRLTLPCTRLAGPPRSAGDLAKEQMAKAKAETEGGAKGPVDMLLRELELVIPPLRGFFELLRGRYSLETRPSAPPPSFLSIFAYVKAKPTLYRAHTVRAGSSPPLKSSSCPLLSQVLRELPRCKPAPSARFMDAH